MKKIIIIFSLILSLFINTLPVYAMEMTYTSSFVIKCRKTQYNDFEFILNSLENPRLEIYFYHTDETVIFTYTDSSLFSNEGSYYFKDLETNKSFYYDYNAAYDYCYDVYILDDNGNRIYKTYIHYAVDNYVNFSSFAPYVEEDNGGTESPGDSESPDNSGSGNDGSVTTLDVSLLHTDLLILIVIIGFFEFMKMINIIVRNYGGDK